MHSPGGDAVTPDDKLMDCPCGRGDYLHCDPCPYWFCSVHGDHGDPETRKVLDRILAELRDAFPDGVTVCLTHKRFIPCRNKEGCVTSSDSRDVEYVRRYQSGNAAPLPGVHVHPYSGFRGVRKPVAVDVLVAVRDYFRLCFFPFPLD